MKRVIYFIAILLAIACSKDSYINDFNQVILDDYNFLISDDISVEFYGAEAILDKEYDKGDEFHVISMYTVFNKKDDIVIITHLEDEEDLDFVNTEFYNSYQCSYLPSISLTEALKILKSSGYKLPESNVVTLMAPEIEGSTDSYYIFGDLYSGLIWINCETGEITCDNTFSI